MGIANLVVNSVVNYEKSTEGIVNLSLSASFDELYFTAHGKDRE